MPRSDRRSDTRSACGVLLACTITGSTLLWAPAAWADDARSPSRPDEEWVVGVTPYIWALAVRGEIETDAVQADFSADFSDIIDDTNAGAMVILDARLGRLVMLLDTTWADLEAERVGALGVRVEAESRQTLVDAKVGYRVWQSSALREGPDREGPDRGRRAARDSLAFDLFLGARYLASRNEIEVTAGSVQQSESRRSDSVDPLIGLRAAWQPTDTLSFLLIGDAGGFGIGDASDFTWGGTAVVGLRMGDRWNAFVGYRVLDIDRSDLDVTLHGPLLGVRFQF